MRVAISLLLLTQPALVRAATPEATAQSLAPTYPAQVRVKKRAAGFYYVDARGMTLYALNQRIAFTRSSGAGAYCVGPCAKSWAELTAPVNAEPMGDWSVVPGGVGPQWAYKKNPVFTYRTDTAPGQTKGDGVEDLWTVIAHVPPAPSLIAPPVVSPLFADGRYVLADPERHALFVAAKTPCPSGCADWTPLLAGMAALDVGDWTVDRDAPRARWTWRGKPVFVSSSDKPAVVPDGGQVLQP